MSSVKEEAIRMIDSFPDDITWNEMAYRFALWAKLQRGLEDCEAGRVISHEQMKAEVAQWVASSGPTHPDPMSAASSNGSPAIL